MEINFAPSFLKQLKKLELELQKEVFEKVNIFKKDPNHPQLKTHKLKGKLEGYYSFSINYKYRIVFRYINPKEVLFNAVGSHDVYKK